MAELCREFGISRKTGYKIFDRYQECLNVKREHSSWSARKIPGVPDLETRVLEPLENPFGPKLLPR
jgi:hypothetical protein